MRSCPFLDHQGGVACSLMVKPRPQQTKKCASRRRAHAAPSSEERGPTRAPSRGVSLLRNSTAPSESSPASMSGASADTLGSSSVTASRTADATSTVLAMDASEGRGAAGEPLSTDRSGTRTPAGRANGPARGGRVGAYACVPECRFAHHHASGKLSARNLRASRANGHG